MASTSKRPATRAKRKSCLLAFPVEFPAADRQVLAEGRVQPQTAVAIVTVAIVNPSKTALEDIKKKTKETAEKTQEVVQEGTRATSEKIDKSTAEIVTTVQDAAIANL